VREQYISKAAQLTNAAALAVLAVLGMYGMSSRVIISHEYVLIGARSAIGLTLLLSFLYYYAYFKKNSTLRRLTGLSAYYIVPAVPCFLLLVLFPSVVWGIPAMAHHLTGVDAEARHRVHAPDVAFRNTTRRCKGRLQLDIEDSFIVGGKICSVPEDVYAGVREGSIVTLRGKESFFGFSYSGIRLEPGT